MSRISLILGIIIGLPILAVVGLMLLLDNPELFRDEITTAVKDQTGFEVKINGGMDWRFFPPIAININSIEVIPPGSDTPLASLNSASIDVKILPLILQGGKVEVDGLSIDGLKLNAIVDKNGKANWEVASSGSDSAEPTDAVPETAAPSSSDSGINLDVQSFSITNTEINYQDLKAGDDYQLSINSLKTGAIKPGLLTELSGDIAFIDKANKMQGSTMLSGKLGFNEGMTKIMLNKFDIDSKISMEGQPELNPSISLTGTIDTAAGTAELKESKMTIANLALLFSISANNIFDVPGLRGHLSVPEFNAKQLAKTFNIELPATSNADALTKLSFETDITGTTSQMVMNNLKFMLDDSTIDGKATATLSPKIGLQYLLNMDAINATDYLPATDTTATTGSDTASASAPVEDSEVIPVALLGEYNLDGIFNLAKLNYDSYELNDIKTHIVNKKSKLSLEASANAFSGELKLKTNLSNVAAGKTVQGSNRLTVSGIDISKVVEFEAITGAIAFDSNTKFSGSLMSQLVNTLDGKSTFTIKDGTLDVSSIKQAGSMVESLQGKPNDVSGWPNTMPFTQMIGSHEINNGLSADQKLSFVTEVLEVDGKGGFDYFANSINYDVTAELKQNPDSQFKVSDQLTGIKWPLHCEGNLDAGAASLCLPDKGSISSLLTQIAKKELRGKGKDKLLEKVPDKYKETAKGLLKGLFN